MNVFIKTFYRKFVLIIIEVLEVSEGVLVTNLGFQVRTTGYPVVLWRSRRCVWNQVHVLITAVITALQGDVGCQQIPDGNAWLESVILFDDFIRAIADRVTDRGIPALNVIVIEYIDVVFPYAKKVRIT